jgi:hypothetical protein
MMVVVMMVMMAVMIVVMVVIVLSQNHRSFRSPLVWRLLGLGPHDMEALGIGSNSSANERAGCTLSAPSTESDAASAAAPRNASAEAPLKRPIVDFSKFVSSGR